MSESGERERERERYVITRSCQRSKFCIVTAYRCWDDWREDGDLALHCLFCSSHHSSQLPTLTSHMKVI